MKNSQKITLGVIGVIIIAIIGVWWFSNISINQNANIGTANQGVMIQTLLQIDKNVKIKKDGTALEQLQKAADENNIPLGIKTESFGSYVDSLDGLKGGTDGKYWMYSVNGKTAEVGADQYKLAEGDVVEWRFTK